MNSEADPPIPADEIAKAWDARPETFTWMAQVSDLSERTCDVGFAVAFHRGGVFARSTTMECWSYNGGQSFHLTLTNGEPTDINLGEISEALSRAAVERGEAEVREVAADAHNHAMRQDDHGWARGLGY